MAIRKILKIEAENESEKRLVLIVQFSLGVVALLTILEIAYLIVLREWSQEIFIIIASLLGNVSGIILGRRVSTGE